MKLIVTLDDSRGMMFNHRRQSRDRTVCQDILELSKASRLLIAPYSQALFQDFDCTHVNVCENPLVEAGKDDYCFIEGRLTDSTVKDVMGNSDKKAEEIIIYKWNRKYPGDTFFDMDMEGYTCASSKDFSGSSHEKITREIYRWCK